MSESLKIEVFRRKDAEDFTKALADPESRAQTGSGAAMTAAVASAQRGDPALVYGQSDRRGR